ncbi:MAG: glycosyltransferase family A protein [Anaerolineales bacterium]|nr:glycosyltransferase family A protein [Anaerolineales bacterium]
MTRHQSCDLLLWSDKTAPPDRWPRGATGRLSANIALAAGELSDWANQSRAAFLLLWDPQYSLPNSSVLDRLMESGVDAAHCGLKSAAGQEFGDLSMVIHDWSMINGPAERPSTSWRLNLGTCLLRRETFLAAGGLNGSFASRMGAGLELGYRLLKSGALIEHRPEIVSVGAVDEDPADIPLDLYNFIFVFFKKSWGRYVLLRRLPFTRQPRKELAAFRKAWSHRSPFEPRGSSSFLRNRLIAPGDQPQVSVIIPTLGRYHTLPAALQSLVEQTLPPAEVIVVDQNPPEERRTDLFYQFEALNLKVVWQRDTGQSLARNTGLSLAAHPYVFFFDDDSIARDDLLEKHLSLVADHRIDASTGVSFPPEPHDYQLPPEFGYYRLSQTFDTGNSLLPTAVAKRIGGFDRNYDFGPGTDTDFGTRLYLSGCRIGLNPEAVRIHLKEPRGGLRVHHSHKYNTDLGLLKPYPPVTQSYYGFRFLGAGQQRERTLLQFATSKFPRDVRPLGRRNLNFISHAVYFLLSLVFLPVKSHFSHKKAQTLLKKGVQLGNFSTD